MLCSVYTLYSEHTHWYVTICKTNPPSITLKILINKSELHLFYFSLSSSDLKDAASVRFWLRTKADCVRCDNQLCIHFSVLRDRVVWLFSWLGCPILLNYLPGHSLVTTVTQPGPLSLVEECRGSALIGREVHSVATPALLCHKEPARASKAPY